MENDLGQGKMRGEKGSSAVKVRKKEKLPPKHRY